MEQKTTVTTDTVEPTPMVTPSPTYYSELANTLVGALDQFNASVPEFDNPAVTKAFIKRKRRVPPELVVNAISAVLVHAELQNVKALNASQAVDDKQFIDAIVPVARHMETVLKALLFNIDARQARLVGSAQRIYAVARAFVRDRDTATLGVHVRNMQRALRASRRPKKAAEAEAGKEKEETATTVSTKSQQ